MQTHFSLAQLADPDVAASEGILRTCVHCGFCTATCPTFALLGDERDSPRGRIYMIKEMLENDRPADVATVTHVDRCLSCLSCMTTCPSGVHYMHLVDHARVHIEKTYRRPLMDRLMRWTLGFMLAHRGRFRVALLASFYAKPLKPLLSRLPVVGQKLGAMLSLSPARIESPTPLSAAGTYPAEGQRRARVALLGGCASEVLMPGINAAAVRLLTRLGVEVVRPKGEGCCGSLPHHMGDSHAAHTLAAKDIEIWWKETKAGGGAGLDAIVVTASGCGTTIKDYGFMFRNDPKLADKAAAISALAKDITEVVTALGGLGAMATRETRPKVAYHAACSLQHGQKIRDLPMKLLAEAGFEVSGLPESHLCCGSAVASVTPDVVAAGNAGCLAQIRSGTATPVVHTVELLDWATGGPIPVALER
jgi:glycolate oxidase iron-sulfur subunit